MKKLNLTIAAILFCSVVFCQAVDTGLGLITEETKTGRRLIGHDPLNYGRIGENAIDLSYSDDTSTVYGARGDNSFATGFKTIAERFYCTAMGIETVASGDRTTALGEYTTASGIVATAMGSNNIASGNFSTAMGGNNIASGRYSTAMGRYTASEGYGTTAIGLYNTLDNNAIPTTLDASNRAFVIGNGTSTSSRSDAMTVLFDGTTTIAGDVGANSFSGDGSGLSNVPSDGLQKVLENGSTGYRLYPKTISSGWIGSRAVDMSSQDFNSLFLTNLGAEGFNSFATGNNTAARGDHSVSMGSSTIASGNFSTAMGESTRSEGYGTTAIGLFNTNDYNATAGTFNATNRALVIGNGTSTSIRSDAMTVLFDGTTTIAGSLSAQSFTGDGSMMSKIGLTMIKEEGNSGWRLSGQDSLNYGPIGINAVDLSISNNASLTTGATGELALATGDRSTASGYYSTAMGSNTNASGGVATAMGNGTIASGNSSTALGYFTSATGNYSTSMGQGTEATNSASSAFGHFTEALGVASTALGAFSKASGTASTALGYVTTATGYGTTAIGAWNTLDINADSISFSTSNRAFIIGNGVANNRSDAMTVLFDGTTTIAGDLTINSDVRLKSNIESLGSTIFLLQQLEGKKYALKTDESIEKIGLLAQDVQKVFPQLVRKGKDEKGILSVNYQGLIPVLINAVNEQQEMIVVQQKQIDQLTEMVLALNKGK